MDTEIKNLKATLSNYGMTKLSNATDVTDANAYALSAVENNPNASGSLRKEIYSIKSSLQYFYVAYNMVQASTNNWFRFLRIEKHNASKGVIGHELTIIINRHYNNNTPEYHRISYTALYTNNYYPVFKSLLSRCSNHCVTKIRAVESTQYIYFDVYHQGATNGNTIMFNTINLLQNHGSVWIESVPSTIITSIPSTDRVVIEYDIPIEV